MAESSPQEKKPLTFQEMFRPIWREKKKIALISVILALVTLGVNFLLPKYYKATAVLLPETDKNKIGLPNQIEGLASLAGVNIPGSDISRLYPVILMSESVLRNVIAKKYANTRFKDSLNLIQYFELDTGSPEERLDDALRILKGLMSAASDAKTGVVTVTLEMREPQLAADVLNSALNELDAFLREKKTTSATEQRKWIESRLVSVEAELRSAEERLKDFREKNRRVSDSPELLLQQDRFIREMQIKSTIDIELRKQAEIAKIEEIKQVSTINLLDEGRAPVKKERPKRATNSAIAFLLFFAGSCGYFVIRDLYGEKIRDYVKSLRSAP